MIQAKIAGVDDLKERNERCRKPFKTGFNHHRDHLKSLM
jgi:hypothetical protein